MLLHLAWMMSSTINFSNKIHYYVQEESNSLSVLSKCLKNRVKTSAIQPRPTPNKITLPRVIWIKNCLIHAMQWSMASIKHPNWSTSIRVAIFPFRKNSLQLTHQSFLLFILLHLVVSLRHSDLAKSNKDLTKFNEISVRFVEISTISSEISTKSKIPSTRRMATLTNLTFKNLKVVCQQHIIHWLVVSLGF